MVIASSLAISDVVLEDSEGSTKGCVKYRKPPPSKLSPVMDNNGIVVLSGGSATNHLVDVFGNVAGKEGCQLSYIIPISDNGGSSSELIRVFGGPGIGDIRSRLVRLIPENVTSRDAEKAAIKTLFNHRLAGASELARQEWLDIVDARHDLWRGISSEKRELVRSFLNLINLEIVKRTRPSSVFEFRAASVGNLFITAARLFTGSFESAIYLLGSITGIPAHVSVIPAINSNFSHHICAGLQDGSSIVGQNAISHPAPPTSSVAREENALALKQGRHVAADAYGHGDEDGNMPGSLPTLRRQYIDFAKDLTEDLPSRIERIWYINPYGQEINPVPNPKVLDHLQEARCIIYSIGSLYTSILPCLILNGVGLSIARSSARFKVLILNGCLDRETGPPDQAFGAIDFVDAIVKACTWVSGARRLLEDKDYIMYVTHVIYLAGEGTPRVQKQRLKELGIETIGVYGKKGTSGGMVYDESSLAQALEVIIGTKDAKKDPSRRNTMNA